MLLFTKYFIVLEIFLLQYELSAAVLVHGSGIKKSGFFKSFFKLMADIAPTDLPLASNSLNIVLYIFYAGL